MNGDGSPSPERPADDPTHKAPDKVAPDNVAPDKVAPDKVAPDAVVPDKDGRTDGLPSGWVTLIRNDWVTEFVATGSWLVIWVVIFGNASNIVTDGLPITARFLAWAGCLAGGLLAVFAWYRFKPVPRVNFDTSEVRRGRRTLPMSEIRWARLLVTETKKSRTITLQFGPGTLRVGSEVVHRGFASYVVRASYGQTRPTEPARLVAEVLRRSRIELPQTPDDPTGRFTWFNFPGSHPRAGHRDRAQPAGLR